MIPQSLIPFLQLGHGLFHLGLFAAFVYQGRLGWSIRRRRLGGQGADFSVVRLHRTLGPILAVLLPIGYLAGLILSYLHHNIWTKYPLHLASGSLLVAAVAATWLISRRIRGAALPWRTAHFILGLAILILFLWQIYLGLNVLL
ncbi:MAG: DUF4079 domain-containing protein [Desulfobulbaceae bacterium]|jgi:hypothetical protein|nr:DUF4079 domain-containing protein [Desulfobulbaceae bacterium]MDY0350493.1 DUF4079 domain-containing protein [Desulfobulbaceae bacterium]